MKKRALRFESLEERQLLAVTAGLDAAAALPAPTADAPVGQKIGDLYVASTIDVDGDGFIGPAELSYMSYAWFSDDGSENWNPESDLDGDGFIGPGDYALLSSVWFKSNDELPDDLKSYAIYPADTQYWYLFGDKISKISARNGLLTIDAGTGPLEAVCDYEGFPDDLRLTADFKAIDSPTFKAGLELDVQQTGRRYYAEIQKDRISICVVSDNEVITTLRAASYSFAPNRTYTVWLQRSGDQLAIGVGDETLLTVSGASLSGGMLGFYASEGVVSFSNISVELNPEQMESPETQVGDVFIITDYVRDGVPLDEPILSYEIYPADIQNWSLRGIQESKVSLKNGELKIDARTGSGEVICGYDAFPNELRVTADFKATDPTVGFKAGIELAVQKSGAHYYAEFSPGMAALYYVKADGTMTLLASTAVSCLSGRTYTVWAQYSGGRLACGMNEDVFLTVADTRLSGGKVGFCGGEGLNTFRNISVHTGPDLYNITKALPPSCLPKDHMELDWWVDRHAANRRVISQGKVDLLLIGDSITHMWETNGLPVFNYYYGDRKCLNMGFGGDQTGNVIWRLDDLPMEKIHPKAVMLLIGVNNLWAGSGESPNDVPLGTVKIVRKLEDLYPDAKILVLNDFPVGPQMDHGTNARVAQANVLLNELLKDDPHVILKNINEIWLDENGVVPTSLMADQVHPTELGYWRWAAAVEDDIAAMLGDTPKTAPATY